MLSKGSVVKHVGNDVIYKKFSEEQLDAINFFPIAEEIEFFVGIITDVFKDKPYTYEVRYFYKEHETQSFMKEEIEFINIDYPW